MGEKFYSDHQMSWGAQASYLNVSQQDITDYQDIHGTDSYPSMKEIFENRIANGENLYSIYYNHDYMEDVKNNVFDINSYTELKDKIENGEPYNIDDYAKTYEEKYMLSILFDMDFNGNSSKSFEPASWCVTEIDDQNSKNGMYGLVLATNGKEALNNRTANAMVSYRGSEHDHADFLDPELIAGWIKDWLLADGSLVYPYANEQQEAAGKLYERVLNDERYATVASSGHSLGGNLAFIAPVLCAGNANIDDKYVQAQGFDAPGVTDDFIQYYKNEINKLDDNMYLYKYTIVGNIFNPIAENVEEAKLNIGDPNVGLTKYHSLCFIQFQGEDVETVDAQDSVNFWGRVVNQWTNRLTSNNITDELAQDQLMTPIQEVGRLILSVQEYNETGDLSKIVSDISKCEAVFLEAAFTSVFNIAAGVGENITGDQRFGEAVETFSKPSTEIAEKVIEQKNSHNTEMLVTLEIGRLAFNMGHNALATMSQVYQQYQNAQQQNTQQQNTQQNVQNPSPHSNTSHHTSAGTQTQNSMPQSGIGSLSSEQQNDEKTQAIELGHAEKILGAPGYHKDDSGHWEDNLNENGHSNGSLWEKLNERSTQNESQNPQGTFEDKINSVLENPNNKVNSYTFDALKFELHNELNDICPPIKSSDDITKCESYLFLNNDYIKGNLERLAQSSGLEDFSSEKFIKEVAEDFYVGRDKEAGLIEFKEELKFNGIQFNHSLENAFENIYDKTGKCYSLQELADISKCVNPVLTDEDVKQLCDNCREQQRENALNQGQEQ